MTNNKNKLAFRCTNLTEVQMATAASKACQKLFPNGRMAKGMIFTISKCEGEKTHAMVADNGWEMKLL